MKTIYAGLIGLMLFFPGLAFGLVNTDTQQIQYENGRVSFKASSVSLKHFLMVLTQKAQIQLYVIENLLDESGDYDIHSVPLEQVLAKCLRHYNYAILYTQGSQEKSGVFNYEKHKTFLFSENETPGFSQSAESVRYHSGAGESGAGQGSAVAYPGVSESFIGAGASGNSHLTRLENHYPTGGSTARMSSSSGRQYASVSGQSAGMDQQLIQEDSTAGRDQAMAEQMPTSYSSASVSDDQRQIMLLEYRIKNLEADINSGRAEMNYNQWIEKKDPKYVYNPWNDLANQQEQLQALLSK